MVKDFVCRFSWSARRLILRTTGRDEAAMDNVVSMRMSIGVDRLSGSSVEPRYEIAAIARVSDRGIAISAVDLSVSMVVWG